MAKQPKKPLKKAAEPSSKPKKKLVKKPTSSTAAKSPKKKPAPAAKKAAAKPAAKKPAVKKPAAKQPVAKKPAAKKPVVKKPVATKAKPKAKSEKPKKPKAYAESLSKDLMPVFSQMDVTPLDGPGTGTGPVVIGTPATPTFTAPLAGAVVTAGANLQVNVNTNRGDLGYIIKMEDTTPPPPPPAPPMIGLPTQLLVAAPAGNNFGRVILGPSLVAGHTYRLSVVVDPAGGGSPPHGSDVIGISAQ